MGEVAGVQHERQLASERRTCGGFGNELADGTPSRENFPFLPRSAKQIAPRTGDHEGGDDDQHECGQRA